MTRRLLILDSKLISERRMVISVSKNPYFIMGLYIMILINSKMLRNILMSLYNSEDKNNNIRLLDIVYIN
jgi:hypothetical protein